MTEPYYDRDGITIYHGDCWEILPEIEGVDLVVTDPPYPNNSGIMESAIPGTSEILQMCIEKSIDKILWFWSVYDYLFPELVTSIHVWHKNNGWQAGSWEAIFEYNKKKRRTNGKVYSYPNVNVEDLLREKVANHLTPKPIRLMKALIADCANDKSTLLDPYMGTGSSIVAAKHLNHKAIGIEIEEKYCEIAVERLRQEVLAL